MSVASPSGAHRALVDRWLRPRDLAGRVPDEALYLIDARVAKLHPEVVPGGERVLLIPGGERAKTVRMLERALVAGSSLRSSASVVAIGGGTIGDLATVAAHLLRRGLRLVQVPTTLLALVDSSVGGKGALNLAQGPWQLRNAVGVFHYPEESWICPELLSTLPESRLREGRVEALKLFACSDARLWRKHVAGRASVEDLIRDARATKADVCRRDPYERTGHRRILNFGHTFGHALETLSRLRLPHGAAVGLGMLCALDLGRRLGITPADVAAEIEQGLARCAGVRRASLASWLTRGDEEALEVALSADKKTRVAGELTMVLVPRLGAAVVEQVARREWRACLGAWRRGVPA
jgi:3-dehydroquinate synthase